MKHVLFLMLTALLLAVLFCCTALADGEITTWAQLQTALNAGGTVTLTEDLEAGSGDTMLQVSSTAHFNSAAGGIAQLISSCSGWRGRSPLHFSPLPPGGGWGWG